MNVTRVLLLAGLSALPLLSAHARVERTVEKSFDVQPGGTLTVSTQGGDIKVEPGSGDQVRIVARQVFPKASNDREADEIAADLETKFEQDGNNVRASARYTKQRRSGFFASWPPVSVSYTVSVPERYSVDLTTSGGDITVGDLAGTAKVRTSGGDLRFGRFRGPVSGSTSGGDIEVDEALERVDLSTSGGDIELGRVTGEVDVSTSGGDIVVEHVTGSVSASTSGGNIRVGIDGPISKDLSFSTSGGDVAVRVTKAAAFRLDASTTGGDVEAEGLTITIEKGGIGKSRLAGPVNGGGPTVKLRTSGGDVSVVAR